MDYFLILILFATSAVSQPQPMCERAKDEMKLAKWKFIYALNPEPDKVDYKLSVDQCMALRKAEREFVDAHGFYCTACMVEDCELPSLRDLLKATH